jgi:hypothetical protein
VYFGEREGSKISVAREVGSASSMEPLGGVLGVCSDWVGVGVEVPVLVGVGAKISVARSVMRASFSGCCGDDAGFCDGVEGLGEVVTSQNWRVGMRATCDGRLSIIARRDEVHVDGTYCVGLRQISPVRWRADGIPHPRAGVDCDGQLCLRVLFMVDVPRFDNMFPHESANSLSCAWKMPRLSDHPLSKSFCLGLGDVICGESDWRVQFRIKIGRVEERIGVLHEFPVWELV